MAPSRTALGPLAGLLLAVCLLTAMPAADADPWMDWDHGHGSGHGEHQGEHHGVGNGPFFFQPSTHQAASSSQAATVGSGNLNTNVALLNNQQQIAGLGGGVFIPTAGGSVTNQALSNAQAVAIGSGNLNTNVALLNNQQQIGGRKMMLARAAGSLALPGDKGCEAK